MRFFRSPRVQFWMALLFPVIAVLIAYAPIYNGPFIWDDKKFLVDWPLLQDPSNYGAILKGAFPEGHSGGYRPLRTLYEALSWQVFRDNPTPYHIQAILFHAIATGTVFLITLQLLKLFPVHIRPKLSTTERNNLPLLLASLGATLFGLHPIMQSSVAFIQGNFDAMGIVYALIAYLLFLHMLAAERKVQQKFMFTTGSIVFASIAFAFFELTYPLPVLIFLTAWLFHRQQNSGKPLFLSMAVTIPSVLSLLTILGVRFFVLNITAGRPLSSPGRFFTFLASTRALFLYITQTIFPIHLAAIHEIAPGISTTGTDQSMYRNLRITDLQTIVVIALLIGLVLLSYRFYKKAPLMVLGGLWFFVGLTPVLNILVPAAIYSERYLYFPLLGFVLLVVSILHILVRYLKSDGNRQLFVILLTVLIACSYGMRTFLRVMDWTNPIYFWTKEIRTLPKLSILHFFLGSEYFQKGQSDQALKELQISLTLDPFQPNNHYNIGFILAQKKKYAQARPYAEQAVLLDPSNTMFFAHLLQLYDTLNNPMYPTQFITELSEKRQAKAEIYGHLKNLIKMIEQRATEGSGLRE